MYAEACINNIFIHDTGEPWFDDVSAQIQIDDNTYSVALYPTIYANNLSAPQGGWWHEINVSPLQHKLMAVGYKKAGVISGMSICDISQIDYSNIVPDDGWLDCSLSRVITTGLR